MASVIPKGSCRDVEQVVVGGRAGEGFHWLRVFGIADGDGFSSEQVQMKRDKGVYALPFYSVEAIYLHPRVIEMIAARQSGVSGADTSTVTQAALDAGIAAVLNHTERLSQKVAKKAVRKLIMDQIPNDDELLAGQQITIENDAVQICGTRKAELDTAAEAGDWESILTKCSVREASALADISTALGFRKIEDYEKAVRHLLTVDSDALNLVRSLFGDLYDQLNG